MLMTGLCGLQVYPCCCMHHLMHCRAKNIKNQAVVNEDADQRTLLRKYERELRKLRAELTRRNQELVDKRHLLEVGPGVAQYAGIGLKQYQPDGCGLVTIIVRKM